MVKRLSAVACGMILLPLSNAVGAESFDVLVMRGSTLVRVTGDENGPSSEVTLREDPTPPAPEVVWEPPEAHTEPVELVIQIFRDDPRPAVGSGFGYAHPIFVWHEKPHHRFTRARVHGKRNPPGLVRHGLRWARSSRPYLSRRTELGVSLLRAPSHSGESPRSSADRARSRWSVPDVVRVDPSNT